MKIAIIGTAGRKDDGPRMSRELYEKMTEDASGQVATIMLNCACDGHNPHIPLEGGLHLISGGAAWADHIAVSLYLMDLADSLTLYFPCYWHVNGFDHCWKTPSRTGHFSANRSATITIALHRQFSERVGHNTQHDIQKAIDKGAAYHEITGGFHARNLLVGKVDALVAYTWADGDTPKPGGTKHAWDNSPAPIKIHRSLSEL